MQQLNIEYFFPLTEQVSLDLNFKPCEDYNKELRKQQTINYTVINTTWGALHPTTWTTMSNNIGNPSFTINVDAMPITIVSKKKPNFILKFIYKSMGMKWKAEQ
jgi:hypothetical protein